MNCLECRELLQKRLDGEVISAPALERHLSECAACREQHAGAGRLLEALQQLPPVKAPANLAQSMVAQVIKDRLHRQQRVRRRVFATMALAASVLVMLLAAYYWYPRPGNDALPKTPMVQETPKKHAPPKQVEEPKVDEKKPEPRNAMAALADRWAGTTRDHAKVLQAAAHLDGVEVPPVPMNPSVREAGQEVTDGVTTVTRNARKAFDYFARELPMPELGEQKN